jgi:hypothetical protein
MGLFLMGALTGCVSASDEAGPSAVASTDVTAASVADKAEIAALAKFATGPSLAPGGQLGAVGQG